jgi:hypothetical protein
MGTPLQWIEGLTRLSDEHGPCFFSACYGDALSDRATLEVFAKLAQRNKVDLVTNMLVSDTDLAILPRNGNVAMATTFQPHVWSGGLKAFLKRREEIRASGIICGIVSVVGYPPYLKRVPAWKEEALDWGVRLYVIPYGGFYKASDELPAKQYPASYTKAEWDLIKQTDKAHYDMTGRNWGGEDSPFGLPCRVGMADSYIFVKHDGGVSRCYMPIPGTLGNVLNGSPIRFLDAPAPCLWQSCPCCDMWQFLDVPEVLPIVEKREYDAPAEKVETVELNIGGRTESGIRLQGKSGTIRLTREEPLAVG